MIATTMEVVSADWYLLASTVRSKVTATGRTTTQRRRICPDIANGGRRSPRAPRGGTSRPVTTIATITNTNGTAANTPCTSQYRVSSDWTTPIARPTIAVTVNELKRPIIAAAIAGS